MDMSELSFALYKTGKYALYPYTWLTILLAAQVALALGPWAPRRLGWIRAAAVTNFIIVFVLGHPLIARSLTAPLESEYSPLNDPLVKEFDAIVVLGGGALALGTLRPSNELSDSSLTRTICGADLYSRGISKKIVFSGGNAAVFGFGPEEAVEMKRLALRLGVPEQAITLETRSRNTYENAVESKRILGNASLLLVTSASHIPRAMRLFAKQGLNATPAPCGYVVKDRSLSWSNVTPLEFIPTVESLYHSTRALTEVAGTWVYRLLGKI